MNDLLIPLKISHSAKLAFRRMNVRLKKEIISMGMDEIRPADCTGCHFTNRIQTLAGRRSRHHHT